MPAFSPPSRSRVRSARGLAFRLVAALAVECCAPGSAVADPTWPSKPVRLVVPFPTGGGSDNVARVLAKAITESLGQPVVVDNRPGAAATLGAQYVAKAPADAYTLLLGNAAVITLTPQLRQAGFDPIRSFVPIATAVGSYAVVAVRKDLPAEDFRSFVALARRDPGRLTCGTSGAGGATHLGCAILADRLGIELRPVHYKGSAPAANDLGAGVIDVIIDPAAMPHVKSGRVRAIAARGREDGRSPDLPGVPGLAEVGAPMGTETWFGLLAPAGTPSSVVAKLAAVVERLVRAPDFEAQMLPLALYPLYMDPKTFAERIPRDSALYGDIIRRTGIQASDRRVASPHGSVREPELGEDRVGVLSDRRDGIHPAVEPVARTRRLQRRKRAGRRPDRRPALARGELGMPPDVAHRVHGRVGDLRPVEPLAHLRAGQRREAFEDQRAQRVAVLVAPRIALEARIRRQCR